MKLSERIKTYNFWVSLSSAFFLIIKVLGNQIGFYVDESLFSDLITSICSILVILGIIVPPKNPELKTKNKNVSINNDTFTNELKTYDDNFNTTANIIESNNNPLNFEIDNNTDITKENFDSNNETNSGEFSKENFNTDIEIVDIDLESANINIENLDNISASKILSQKEEFESNLKIYKKAFENNIEEYINILETEINNLRCK